MVLELVFGFLVLVAASYVGTTMALRGFFGRERYVPSDETGGDGPSRNDDARQTDDVPRAGDLSSDDADDE